MSNYDILKGLSELDEDLIMKPRRFVSLRMNVLLCFLAGEISAIVSSNDYRWNLFVFFFVFFVLYVVVTLFLNRKRNRKLIIE